MAQHLFLVHIVLRVWDCLRETISHGRKIFERCKFVHPGVTQVLNCRFKAIVTASVGCT